MEREEDSLSLKPFASTILTAWSMMFDMSTCTPEGRAQAQVRVSSAPSSSKEENGDTHADDVLRARLGGEHAEDARAAADVEHELVLEQVRVVDDRVAVRARAHGVLQHLLMDACPRDERTPEGPAVDEEEGRRSPKCAYESA